MDIIVENVSKSINHNYIIKDVSMKMHGGEIYGLWGKNGCGKTMLMRIISGLVRTDEGTVLADGMQIGKEIDFIQDMGIMLETPGFIEHYTAKENLLAIAEIKQKVTEKRIDELLELMGLNNTGRKKIKKFSLGMRQKVGIISAIMEEPAVIILDEPFNALDIGSVKLVKELIKEQKERGALIIVSCHDKDEMNEIADTVYCMEEGKIISTYDCNEVDD